MSETHDTFMIRKLSFLQSGKQVRETFETAKIAEKTFLNGFIVLVVTAQYSPSAFTASFEGQILPLDTQTVLNMPVVCCDKVLYFLEHLLSCYLPSLLQLVISLLPSTTRFKNLTIRWMNNVLVEVLCSRLKVSGFGLL